MGSHPWVGDFLAVVMLAIAAYCIARLVVSFRTRGVTQRDSDAVHAVMGVSMAGMLVPSLSSAPNGLWILVFSGSALWFGWKVLHDSDRADVGGHPLGSHLTHLLMCAAMIYMLLVMDWSGSMHVSHGVRMLAMGGTSTSGSQWPVFAVVLTALIFGDVAINAALNLRRLGPTGRISVGELAMTQGGEPGYVRGASDGQGNDQSDNVPPDVHTGPTHLSRVLAPRSAVQCQLVMGLVMGYMLVTLA
jgi:hypothetical protein